MTQDNTNFSPVLLSGIKPDETESLAKYLEKGGYAALRKALSEMSPDKVAGVIKDSGLRGRGGAGFPTGMKWSFLPRDSNNKVYLTCNADESEPGTCKDRPIIEHRPHLLLEGCLLCCFAIKAEIAYIYIRGEYPKGAAILEKALTEAYSEGLLGKNIKNSNFSCDIYVHRGAGAYVCGEETGLLESLEGKRGMPRNKPPFPAIKGLYQSPTVINNVETLAAIPSIINNGADWFKSFGTEKSSGFKIYSVSGHINKPGNYELPMKTTLREIIYTHAGGIKGGGKLKAVIPGGSSTPVLTESHLDITMDFEGVQSAGSMLGSAGVIVLSDKVCMVWALQKLAKFYRHESCGQCTPCREGTTWLYKIINRIENGQGRMEDIPKLEDICKKIMGRSICALGDAAAMPVLGFLKYFKDEFLEHIKLKRCPIKKGDIHIF